MNHGNRTAGKSKANAARKTGKVTTADEVSAVAGGVPLADGDLSAVAGGATKKKPTIPQMTTTTDFIRRPL